MPLNKPALKQSIKDAQNAAKEAATPAEAEEIFATRLSDAIDVFVKSGLVTVTVTGGSSAGPHNGAVT